MTETISIALDRIVEAHCWDCDVKFTAPTHRETLDMSMFKKDQDGYYTCPLCKNPEGDFYTTTQKDAKVLWMYRQHWSKDGSQIFTDWTMFNTMESAKEAFNAFTKDGDTKEVGVVTVHLDFERTVQGAQ